MLLFSVSAYEHVKFCYTNETSVLWAMFVCTENFTVVFSDTNCNGNKRKDKLEVLSVQFTEKLKISIKNKNDVWVAVGRRMWVCWGKEEEKEVIFMFSRYLRTFLNEIRHSYIEE